MTPATALFEVYPDRYYWVRKRRPTGEPEIGRVSTVFGDARDYWTLAMVGSETHHMLDEYEFLAEVPPRSGAS
jgi:hypothetical protein